ncbi:MAG: HIT family protein [Nanoarchaeota archaeon]
MRNDNCVFCKIIKGEIKTSKVEESDNLIAILDANPKSEGHTLIIPKRHYVTILDIPEKLSAEILKMVKKVSSDLLEKKKGDGFNIIMNNLPPAGQVVMHAHIHIIPRKENDGLRMIS